MPFSASPSGRRKPKDDSGPEKQPCRMLAHTKIARLLFMVVLPLSSSDIDAAAPQARRHRNASLPPEPRQYEQLRTFTRSFQLPDDVVAGIAVTLKALLQFL
jgi:hypothetical protein